LGPVNVGPPPVSASVGVVSLPIAKTYTSVGALCVRVLTVPKSTAGVSSSTLGVVEVAVVGAPVESKPLL
jgi:hypothetical protein